MLAIRSLAVLLLAAVVALAVPTSPDTAKRSYTSAGLTCYYNCPSTLISVTLGTLTLGGTTTTSNGYGVCTYGLLLVSYDCQYDATTGVPLTGNFIFCPTSLSVTCGNQPSNSFRKRSMIENKPREITAKDERLAKRQYKFKKGKKRELQEVNKPVVNNFFKR